jgi:hypothetical protein
MTQTDVLEAGRAITDMMSRELEQVTPTQAPDRLFNTGRYRATNFFVEPQSGFGTPLTQWLPGNDPLLYQRTNIVQRFFFLSRVNQDWIGTGYQVLADFPGSGVGTLYRFCATNRRSAVITVNDQFLTAPLSAFSKIADGVVHLTVKAYATNGFIITPNPYYPTNGFAVSSNLYGVVENTIVLRSAYDRDQSECYFMSNAVPAFVELELGILEPQVLQRFRAIGVAAAQRNYLSNHTAQVHLFRQRVPVRNVDFSAYQ